jgi:hypothetical protein
MVIKESSFPQVLLLPISFMKMLLEIDHYIQRIIMLFFPMFGYPNSHQYLQYLDSLMFQYLPYLSSVVQQTILTVIVDFILLFPLNLCYFNIARVFFCWVIFCDMVTM